MQHNELTPEQNASILLDTISKIGKAMTQQQQTIENLSICINDLKDALLSTNKRVDAIQKLICESGDK